jgi:peptidoglycan hydrolase-like protein with peptidoglycan-binding domain
MKKLVGIAAVFAFIFAFNIAAIPAAHAETTGTTSVSSLLETVKSLLAKIEELKKELANVHGDINQANGDIKAAIKAGLKEGMTDEDIKKVQELLAADKNIYPEGKVTGYFGPLTKEAIKRFQTKHSIQVSGELDEETRDIMKEYFSEKSGGHFPQGIFHAPGIAKKIQDRFCEKKGPSFGGWFCKMWTNEDDDADDDDDDADDDDDTEDFKVTVTTDDGETTVKFTEDGEEHEVEVDSTSTGRVLTEVAEELDTTVKHLDKELVAQIKEALADALEADEDVTEDEAEAKIMEVQDAIDDLQEDIDEADEDVDVDEAQDALETLSTTHRRCLTTHRRNLTIITLRMQMKTLMMPWTWLMKQLSSLRMLSKTLTKQHV